MKNKSVTASLWTILGSVSSQLLRLGANLILTRLLVPEAFGLMIIVSVVQVGVAMFCDIGIKTNIIRHPRAEDPDVLNTAWTMQVVRGLFMWGVIVIIACLLPVLNSYDFFAEDSAYKSEQLPLLLIVTGSIAFISGFQSPRVWLAQRNMRLGRVTLLDLFTQLIGSTVMICGAWYYQSIWALVTGIVISELAKTVLSYFILVGPSNYFCWKKEVVIEFLHFGKWLLLSAIMTFLAANGDRVILGGMLTPEQLGFYAIAYFLSHSLRDLTDNLIQNVCYPLLSEINRNGKQHIVTTYYRLRSKLDLLIYFSVGSLLALAPFIIKILYDDRYLEAGWMLQILAIAVIASCFRLGSSLLLAMGNSKVITATTTLKTIALFIMLPFGFQHFGIEGAIWAIVISSLFEVPAILFFFAKYKMISWYKEFIFAPVIALGYGAGLLFLKIFN